MAHLSFGNLAPVYWEKNFSVIPLESGEKRPAKEIKNWSGYCNNLPAAKTREAWRAGHADAGIGVLLGMEVWPGFRLAAVDVDDDRYVRLARALLGNPVCGKRGKKGATFFVKVDARVKLQATTMKDAEKRHIVDFLAANKMTVIPPSLHPETGQPYEWIGKPLADCGPDDLLLFGDADLKLLASIVAAPETAVLMAGVGTHDAAVSLSARLVSMGCADARIHEIIRSILPESYDGNTMDELQGMIDSARAKGFDESSEDESDAESAKAVRAALAEGIELFHDGDRGYFSVPQPSGGLITHPVKSASANQWLRRLYHGRYRKPLPRRALSDAVDTLEALALFEGENLRVSIRVGGHQGTVSIDLGTADGRRVEITAAGWSIEAARPGQRFYRASGFEELPEPVRGGTLRDLQTLLGLDDKQFFLICAYLLNCLNPNGPYFSLLIEGEQGSGKSFLCSIIKMLIDPNRAAKLRLPDNERDLMIHAKEYHLLVYDNASGMRADMSDTLCSLSTGGGIGVRRLYSDDELQVMCFSRPYVINGISGYAKRPDFLERAIPLKLSAMIDGDRQTEAELLKKFLELRPALLGALYDVVVVALSRIESVSAPSGIRMADAARWIAAAATALQSEPDALIAILKGAQDELHVERINEEPLVIRLREIVQSSEFEGYISELFSRLDRNDGLRREPGLPRTAAHLSSHITRLKPSMAKAGLHVEFMAKGKNGRKIRVWQDEYRPPLDGKF